MNGRTRLKKKFPRPLSPRVIESRKRKDREVRDLYNKLMRKYKSHVVYDWFDKNYFIQEDALLAAIRRCDNQPVDMMRASITYLTAINQEFHL